MIDHPVDRACDRCPECGGNNLRDCNSCGGIAGHRAAAIIMLSGAAAWLLLVALLVTSILSEGL